MARTRAIAHFLDCVVDDTGGRRLPRAAREGDAAPARPTVLSVPAVAPRRRD